MESITLFPCDSKGNILSGYCVTHLNSLNSIASTIYGWKKFGVKFYKFDGNIIAL